jgi:hypothetical protein
MADFLIEAYLPASQLVETYPARSHAHERAAREGRARSAADELTGERMCVRFDRSIYVPEDDICFFVFDAPSRREAALVARRAELDPLRVVEAISSRKEEPRSETSRKTADQQRRKAR